MKDVPKYNFTINIVLLVYDAKRIEFLVSVLLAIVVLMAGHTQYGRQDVFTS